MRKCPPSHHRQNKEERLHAEMFQRPNKRR